MFNRSFLVGCGVGGSDAHLYWRLNFPSGSAQTTTVVTEAEMRALSGGADQCSGGTAASSGAKGSNTADKAFNDALSYSDFWESAGDGACWLQYQFSAPVKVGQIVISVYAIATGYGPSSVELQHSDNGSDFTTLETFTPAAWSGAMTQTFTVTP